MLPLRRRGCAGGAGQPADLPWGQHRRPDHYEPRLELTGHFHGTITKQEDFGVPIGASLDVKLGLTATAGVELTGHFGLTEGADFSGDAFLSATPSTPTVVANGSIGFKLGAQVIIRPARERSAPAWSSAWAGS